ncbi:unnamed protein product [Kuraishia capsulata CBS 1993]|uniref:NAD-dependent epimerase/dehydratase domain-containing protein n=1 Tax=Kuraishia capsulata CBS 1993 TaxID=1382522 RepID=W6MWC9_9ASCO|nr:uncharacterized protein KUCA_T00003203001 [Kuraishia capsulata CBS 1993]CDK27225.1 unnamed protein product [Kuraishia capsulata CBS 1993]
MSVFISGASGYIALHIVDQLLSAGYPVVGTVRTQKQADSITAEFAAKYPEAKLTFELVSDIRDPNAFDSAIKAHPEVEFVLHTASPFAYGLGEDMEHIYLTPAVNGTVGILKAIKAYAPQVRHVVVTSSFAAILDASKFTDPTYIHTEESWNPMEWEEAKKTEHTSYRLSKKTAEKAARDFVKNEKPNFTISTVNPPFVMGPQLFESSVAAASLNTSAETVNQVLALKPDAKGPFTAPNGLSIDVRDVARLHVLPLADPSKYADARLFPVTAPFCVQSVLDVLHDKFPGIELPVGDPEVGKKFLQENIPKYDISKTLEITGVSLIPFEKMIYDSAKQILDYRKQAK